MNDDLRIRGIVRMIRTGRQGRPGLATDLAAFQTGADLLELSATLSRYPDQDTEEIRDLVDWTRAA